MKRLLVIALLVWAAAFRAGAQMPDIYEQLNAHPEYLDGTDFLCPTGPARSSGISRPICISSPPEWPASTPT